MENATWLPAPGFHGYEVNSYGQIRSLHKRFYHKDLSPRLDNQGYFDVTLSKQGKKVSINIHRLVALAFLPNPEGKPQVNHINGNKLDNRIENLEWCTCVENIRHSFRKGLVSRKSKAIIDKCTGSIYRSCKEVSVLTNIKCSTLRNYLQGKIKHKTSCFEYLS